MINITLYKSATCPQCKVAKMKLERKGLSYNEVYVENMDSAALEAAGVRGIPTLIVEDEAKKMTIKLTALRDISKWIDAQEVSNG